MNTREHRKATMTASGFVKVSYRVLVPGGETWASTGILETEQEWVGMAKAYAEDAQAGHLGPYLVIPKGITLVALRRENIPGLEAT